MIVKVDFHVHTVYSPDSVITFQDLRDGCREKGIDVVAIMDHDVIEGAFEFAFRSEELLSRGEWAPRVLVGEEVRTTKGEICGLFLSEWVPDNLPPRETMDLIKGQGGLVYVPHPFDLLKLKRLKASELVELSGLIDIVEEFNGKPRLPLANVLARRFLGRHPFTRAAGSDAHEPTHLGAAFVEMEDFSGPADLMEKLAGGSISGKIYSPFASAYTLFRIRRKRKAGDRMER
ncbi:MAG: PHP domain-containing protein [Actinobacteria bacterium]|nr:PHP domain-containing protein [Actinomycetota bacterium]MBU4240041.1 PHP domain-containing protein [Actinomycetota bacterium]MBU4301651.1 PHP domain-containing protein [Actinomycetota bacterium]MBU4386549.1 PHP domain-containing protein [Actinomycetota bacterium]